MASVDDAGTVGATVKLATPTQGPDAVVAAIAAAVAEVGGADRLGLGTPGVVDHEQGTVGHAPNLRGWGEGVPLRRLLEEALPGTAIHIDNDVNVGLLGEQVGGAAQGRRDVLGVFVGTGVGGGLIVDGQLRRGPRGITGEIGHVTVVPDGRRCVCGGMGHLEAYAGRAAIEAEAVRRHELGRATALVDLAGGRRMKSGVIARALAAGDEVATELIDEAVMALGLALSSAVTLVDITTVVLGGGVAEKLGSAFVERVAAAVRQHILAGTTVDVVLAALGDAAGVVGAAALANDPRGTAAPS